MNSVFSRVWRGVPTWRPGVADATARKMGDVFFPRVVSSGRHSPRVSYPSNLASTLGRSPSLPLPSTRKELPFRRPSSSDSLIQCLIFHCGCGVCGLLLQCFCALLECLCFGLPLLLGYELLFRINQGQKVKNAFCQIQNYQGISRFIYLCNYSCKRFLKSSIYLKLLSSFRFISQLLYFMYQMIALFIKRNYYVAYLIFLCMYFSIRYKRILCVVRVCIALISLRISYSIAGLTKNDMAYTVIQFNPTFN